MQAARVTLLSERRRHAPKGIHGGSAGKCGANFLNNERIEGKVCLNVQSGDCVRIETPGGGAFGSPG